MRTSYRWIFGLAAALCLSWLLSALFLNTIAPLEFDEVIQRHVKSPGTVYKHRTEGWATNKVGKHGILGIPDITRVNGPKIAIWGDSFVEAVQVDDNAKTAQVLTSLMAENRIDATAFSVGGGGLSVADYFFAIPAYEQAIPGIAAHVIILGAIMDVMPDLDTLCHSQFLSSPPRLVHNECTPSNLALKYTHWLYALSMPFAYELFQKAKSPLRFLPGTATTAKPNTKRHILFSPDDSTQKAWNFLLEQFKQLTTVPIVFLYIPELPMLKEGDFLYTAPNRKTVEQFADTCRTHGISFLDATQLLLTHFERTGRLTRGFFNMPPGEGHLNEEGHQLAAQAILIHLKEQGNAFQ